NLKKFYSFNVDWDTRLGIFLKGFKQGLFVEKPEKFDQRGTFSLYAIEVGNKEYRDFKSKLDDFRNGGDFKYNFKGLFGFVHRAMKQKEESMTTAYFCSQFVSHILKASELVDYKK